jgi:cell division transport system permease protein
MFRTDLPLGGDSASRFVPWLVAIMVFLGTLAVSGVNVFDSILAGWSRSVTGTVTVQIPPLPAQDDDAANRERAERAVRALQDIEAVESARLLTGEELDRLLEPWLGTATPSAELPLPALIDVTLADRSQEAIDSLSAAVVPVVPDAIIDDHRRWFDRLVGLTEAFRVLALGITAVIIAALALTVIYATRASLAEFRDVIDVLHFVGARDTYIAAQFGKRTLESSTKGAAGGFIIGLIAVLVVSWLAASVESGFLPDVALGLWFWISVPAVAIMAALLAMVTAFLTVMSTLRTML